ncbi:MAG: type II toxin-antitoxin system HicB family antitoxin, partial [Firmicutes bacterium]|nr:type II toxin-antitoxin system HicB family antitoxin [Bacillota bacterium]
IVMVKENEEEMLSIYPAIIHEGDGVWIEFPDLEGCQTAGDNLEEAMATAQEALGLYLASLADRHLPLPPASDLSRIKCPGAQKSYITVDYNSYRKKNKAVKRMVSLPQWMAEEADNRKLSLSKALQNALAAEFAVQ